MGFRAGFAVSLLYLSGLSGISAIAPIPNDWKVGLNEMWLAEYLFGSGIPCKDCPGNVQNRTLPEMTCRMKDLAGNQHVGVYREILPLSLLQPDADFDSPLNQQARALLAEVFAVYADFNVYVVFAFGRPAPPWMSASTWCLIPLLNDTSGWSTFKNSMSWSIGNFTNWLFSSQSPAVRSWMQTHLLVEPFNEFDNVNDAACQLSDAPSPERSADLTGGVMWVLNYYNVPVQVISSSVTGTYPGMVYGPYMQAYYAAGGVGLPNMHFYTTSVSQLEAGVANARTYLPDAVQDAIVLGETGFPQQGPGCPNGMPDDQRAALYAGIAASATLQRLTTLTAFWRIMQLSLPNPTCENWFGVTSADNSGYVTTGTQLFRYLGGTGTNYSCGESF